MDLKRSDKVSGREAAIDPELWLDEHGDALYAFAMMRLSNPATAEDLVQETLLAALSA
ncbi:MAG: sigma factor, partial [Gammaproteobacteria bacterium]